MLVLVLVLGCFVHRSDGFTTHVHLPTNRHDTYVRSAAEACLPPFDVRTPVVEHDMMPGPSQVMLCICGSKCCLAIRPICYDAFPVVAFLSDRATSHALCFVPGNLVHFDVAGFTV